MNKRFLYYVAGLLLMPCPPASAAVFERDWKAPGDGLLTFDDVNKREWLDLSETNLALLFPGSFEHGYQSVVAELAPGRLFEGFSTAKSPDVTGLAESAGVDTGTLDFSTNEAAVGALIGNLSGSVGFMAEIFPSDAARSRRMRHIPLTATTAVASSFARCRSAGPTRSQ